MAKPKRTFTGQEGQRSTGTAGPDAIRRDFDAAFAMFDPNAILPDGDTGGIGAENMKPGAATDEVIGDRTINDSTTPSGDTDKLTTLLSNLANRIRAIMGTSSWRSGPPTTLQAVKDHIDAPAPHSGHETPAGAQAKVDAHANRRDNPHQVTAAQVGAITSVAGISNPGGGVDIVAGSAISITKDTTNKRIIINAHTEGAAPGPHASTHASGGSDPITPAMIGLGNVQNYGIATQAEAETGTANNKYMTPLRTAQAIAALAPVKSVAGRTGAVTLSKSDVGLGNVENYGIATQAEAEAGTANNKYMTPLRVAQAIAALAGAGVVEMGSNANGTYVRWGNGLQVCWHFIKETRSTTTTTGQLRRDDNVTTWTFPATFITSPAVYGTVLREVDDNYRLFFAPYSVTAASVKYRDVATASSENLARTDQLLALGRWK